MPRLAVVIPGGNFGPHTPTLAYPRFAAEARGAEILALEWGDRDALVGLREEDRAAWVAAELADRVPIDRRPLLLARSLGTFAASIAAEHRLPAVWVSPVMTDAAVVDGLHRRTAPALLVGGSRDPLWDGTVARSVSDRVVEIEGADRGVMRPGPLAASAVALGEFVTAVEGFLDALDADAWPG